MRVISAARAPAPLAVSRHVVVTVATSLMMALAAASPRPKYSAAASRRSSEQVPSSRSMFVVSTRALRSVGNSARAGSSENRSGSLSHASSYSKGGLRAANAIAPRQSDRARAALQIDMHLEVSHRGTIPLVA
jgi:hypothetical protein